MKSSLNKMGIHLLAEMLKSTDNPIEKCEIICEMVNRGIHSVSTRNAIARHKKDNSVFWNTYYVSDFATAALHILGWEEYAGNRREIKRLINSGLRFT